MTADSRRLSVRLDSLAANVRRYREAARGLIACVDHDGFGHGLVPVARACLEGGADLLAVADFDEALRLRDAGIAAPLLALRPTGAVADGLGVQAAVATQREADDATALGASGAHVVIDCGGAPRGIRPDDRGAFEAIAGAVPPVALMGVADARTRHAAASAALHEAAALAPELSRHLHGTAGVLAGYGADDAYVRVGRGLYGIPLPDGTSTGAPVARLTGQVVTVKRILAGEGVSYGYIYRAPEDGTIALVTCGYADGVPRSIGNRATVLVDGCPARVIGRVAMDVVVIDVGDAVVHAGDEVVFLGDPAAGEPTVSEWASITGFDPVEIAAAMGPRVVRSYTR
ncbi:alanine racemase [Pseudolysinimonas sp.]|uniref:alanine racemase n=1 Tax=Pseudolysinimonas sp. TaxID=2680009 RepID=UPI003F7CE3C1